MTYEDIVSIADYLKGRTTIVPDIGVICGSGLGGLGENLDKDHPTVVIPYDDVPKFPKTTGNEGKEVVEPLNGGHIGTGH